MVEGSDLTDITGKVLGNHSGIIPASFGDFNGDKLTDMIVLKSNQGEETITIKVSEPGFWLVTVHAIF